VQTAAEKITRYLWLISFCGLALFIPFSISGANISIGFGFLGSIIAMIALPDARRRYLGLFKDPLLPAALLLVVSALPSVFMSENFSRARGDWESYWLLIIYFFVAYNLTSLRLRRVVFWILFASASISCLVSLVQYQGGVDAGFIHIAGEARPASTLFIMTFAGILAQVIAVNFCVLFRRGRFGRLEGVMVAGLLLQAVGLFLTMARGAWVALFGGLVVGVLLLRRRGPLVAAAAILAVLVAFAATDDRVRRKAASIVQIVNGPTDVNVSTRFVLWDVSWELFKQNPILGVGMGDYEIEARKLIGERHVETATDSHNVYLQILVTRGLVGFIPFLFFWFVLIRMLFKTRAALAEHKGFAWHFVTGVIAATVALLIGALTENNIDDSEVFTTFLLLAGIARSLELFPEPGRADTDG
jgi:O-antigen ligase